MDRDGARGTDGNDGATGAKGDTGDGTRIVFRKSLSFELTARPDVRFNGSTFTFPGDTEEAWQTAPYTSKEVVGQDWALSGPDASNIDPKGIDIDTSVQPNVAYVVGGNGYVYTYETDGTYMSRWALVPANRTPQDIDVRGNLVRILDGETVSSQEGLCL